MFDLEDADAKFNGEGSGGWGGLGRFFRDERELDPEELPMSEAVRERKEVAISTSRSSYLPAGGSS